jgi:hypothetical protein
MHCHWKIDKIENLLSYVYNTHNVIISTLSSVIIYICKHWHRNKNTMNIYSILFFTFISLMLLQNNVPWHSSYTQFFINRTLLLKYMFSSNAMSENKFQNMTFSSSGLTSEKIINFTSDTKSGSLRFHSFPVVDWFCLFIYLWVLTFPL